MKDHDAADVQHEPIKALKDRDAAGLSVLCMFRAGINSGRYVWKLCNRP